MHVTPDSQRVGRSEGGAVMVMVAAWLPVLALLVSFAVDFAHFFDYSRNLQNRADAAAFAAGVAYGNACFSTPSQAQLDTIGHAAQQYAGPPNGTPNANLPYRFTDVTNYQNQPNLSAGSPNDLHLLLNASTSWENGGVSFEKGTFCSTSYTNPPDAATDAWITQAQLPLFFPLLGFKPNISAHARVELQQLQIEEGVKPIGVRDASFTPCVTANFLDNDGTVIASTKLTKTDPNGTLWTSSANPVSVTMPSSNPVTVQLFLNNCSSTSPSGTKFDYYDDKGKEQTLGLVYIDNYGTPTAPAADEAPAIADGGVSLIRPLGTTQSTCDPYFTTSTSDCQVGVDAKVAFQPGLDLSTASVRAVMSGIGRLPLTHGTGTDWSSNNTTPTVGAFTVPTDSGIHTVSIEWAQTTGTVGGKTCTFPANNDPYSSANPCHGTFPGPTVSGNPNVQQRLFAGTNGTNLCGRPTYDTGPMEWISIGSGSSAAGVNALGTGSHDLFVSTSITGLKNAPPDATAADDICLRIAEQQSHATGFVDCGQGLGTPADANAIVNGCPPVQKNIRFQSDGSLTCTPAISPPDCVQNDPGQAPPILRAFDDLIGQGNEPANCPANNWPNVDLTDPRAVVLIITAPTDMAVAHGTADIPIRDFAVFYVTGWSTGAGVKGCSNNDAEPGGSGPPGQDGKIWGHWTSVAVPSGLGQGNGQQCDLSGFGNCIAVLTR